MNIVELVFRYLLSFIVNYLPIFKLCIDIFQLFLIYRQFMTSDSVHIKFQAVYNFCYHHKNFVQIVLEDKVKRGFTTVLEKKEELNRSLKEITKDMIPSYKRILKNKAVVYLMIGDIFLFLHYGAFTFYPKIYSLLFRYTLLT